MAELVDASDLKSAGEIRKGSTPFRPTIRCIMKYRYLIFSISEGQHIGTDSEEVALEYARSEDYFVVDAERGENVWDQNERTPINETEQA